MRKFIVDTDTGSDDAVALMMCALSSEIELLGVTTSFGNVPLEQATKNALMTLEVCGCGAEVYEGAEVPMFRKRVTAVNVHGQDGMGECGLIHPSRKASGVHAVDFMLDAVRKNDGVEIVTLGPATNVATAIIRDRGAMSRVKRIYCMGTGGFGPGNTTPVAEFNIFSDPESFELLLRSGIPLTIIGFDMCLGDAPWSRDDLELIGGRAGTVGVFAVECNKKLLEYNLRRSNSYMVDLPDPVAMGVALWDGMTLESKDVYCVCCTGEGPCYGQVVVYDPSLEYAVKNDVPPCNATMISKIDVKLYKERLAKLLEAKAQPVLRGADAPRE